MSSLITYFEVLSSLVVTFFFIRWFVVRCAECCARAELEDAIKTAHINKVKAILITRSKRLSSEMKLDAQNWLDEKSK